MYLLIQAVFFLSAMVSSLFFLHMLQLESYQTPGYWRWLKDKADAAGLRVLPALLLLLLCATAKGNWILWGAVVLFGLCALLAIPRKRSKKPLRFTARMNRLLAALALLLGALSFLVRLPVSDYYRIMAAGVAFVLLPFWVMLANWVTLPVQKAVNSHYIRDAQKKLRSHPNLLIIGVTGSYGKTSVKNILARLLSVHYSTYATPESYNTPMGIVRSIREGLNATHDIFICEMGARHVGDIKECCAIVQPHHGLITSIGPMHLETFKSMENIVKTKFELIRALPSEGFAFLNEDNEFIRDVKVKNRVPFALTNANSPDLWAEDIRCSTDGTHFTVATADGRRQDFTTPLLGSHQVSNILAAIAVCDRLGIPLGRLCGAVRGLSPVPHRLHLIPGGRLNIIDDAFNSNPAGAAAALEVLGSFEGLRIMVTPGMVELGLQQEALNQEFGCQAAAACDYVALVGEKQSEPILRGLESAEYPTERVKVFTSLEDAMAWVRGLAAQDTRPAFVLLENDLPENY